MAPAQPHLVRLRVERQHRLIEELRLASGHPVTAENLAAALGVDVRPSSGTAPASATSASPGALTLVCYHPIAHLGV